jgi:hypothetical protein
MTTNTKSTAKSCSCQQCQYGKHSRAGHRMIKADERAYRHAAKIALDMGLEDIPLAPKGNYYD